MLIEYAFLINICLVFVICDYNTINNKNLYEYSNKFIFLEILVHYE